MRRTEGSRSAVGSTGLRRPWLWLLLGSLAALAASGAPAAGDMSLLDRLNFHPNYDTTYQVAREQKTWKQKMLLDRQMGLAKLKLILDTMDKEEERRNDFQKTQRRLSLDLDRSIGAVRLYLNGIFDRDKVDQTITGREINNDKLSLGGELKLLNRSTTKVFMDLDGGYVGKEEVNIRRRTGGYTADSTQATGLRAGTGLTCQWSPVETFSIETQIGLDTASKESESLHAELANEERDATVLKATDRDRSRDYRFKGEWTRLDQAKILVNGSYSDASRQYYRVSQQDQETQENKNQSLSLLVEGDLSSSLWYGLDFTHKTTEIDYTLEPRDQRNQDTDFQITMDYALEGLPIVGGTSLSSTFTLGEGERRIQTGNSYSSERASLRGELSRSFGEALEVRGESEIRLIQDFYDDETLDEDEQSIKYKVNARYKPSQRFNGSINYEIDNREIVRIAGENSAGNLRREDYKILAKYDADLPAGIKARQVFQISASYQFFVYTPETNTLSRTNRVSTTLDLPFFRATMVTFNHDFLNTDSGAYIYSPADGTRSYNKASESMRQKLTVRAVHNFTPELYVKAEEDFEVTNRRSLSTDTRTRLDKLNLTWEVGFNRRFPSGLDVKARVARTYSTKEDDYWRIQADAGMKF